VRRGDFADVRGTESYTGRRNVRLPIEWYVAAVRALRKQVGRALPFLLFSDGSDVELGPLLEEAGVSRYHNRNALSDLLLLSKARVIVASGSTYSMWASFLGQAPTIWFPGQRRQCVTQNPDHAPEWEPPAELPDGLLAAVCQHATHADTVGSQQG
jgi:hypothetical protein